ncbi:MAG: DNA replication and repair protein RecF [Gammaproteobacteria bacterium]|nr:DNA replication and repair protein RecF [Gammaproteobacteria bacterium]
MELLKIHNGRNLKEYTLEAHPFFNIIYGSNGVGKTTILESVYLLLRSKTFRSSKYKSFINHDENTCTVFSRFISDDQGSFTLGISRSKDLIQPVLHLNSKKINSLSAVTNLVVLALITPESFTLLDAGPSIRRKFIDWGVFHVEPNFLSDWRSYKKILSSRNNLLSNFSKSFKLNQTISKDQFELLDCWTPQLVELNTKLDLFRVNQIKKITPYFLEYLKSFSVSLADEIVLKYYRGWSKDLSYDDYLKEKINEDLSAGFTRFGTHRGELRISFKKNMAKDILSRGQKKIVIICLILAQFRYLIELENNRENNILLLDDIDSELDESNLSILFKILHTFNSQIFVTTTNSSKYNFINKEDYKLFHVEHD